MPHTGTFVPEKIFESLTPLGQTLQDTDWNVDRLYADLLPDTTQIRANFHRYVIDPNRDPSGQSLYPGQNTTGLCPTTDFDGHALYRPGLEPRAEEIESRRLQFHSPYHAALNAEIARVKARHGIAILYDCHSIQSHKPFLFDGKLPDFNIGTNGGGSCDQRLQGAVADICNNAEGFSAVINGRFRGGWTTRHYGCPQDGIHAIQMELTQSSYMDEIAPWTYRPAKASRMRPHLKHILQTLERLAKEISA